MGVLHAMIADRALSACRGLRAGTGLVKLEASTLGQALRELGRLARSLEGSVLRQGTIH